MIKLAQLSNLKERLKLTQLHKHSFVVFFEGKWEVWTHGKKELTKKVFQPDATFDIPDNSIVALPTKSVYSLILHLACRDASLIPKLIPLQIEARGITPKNGDDIVHAHRIIEKNDHEATVHCAVASDTHLSLFKNAHIDSFDIFPNLFPLPEDSLVLWKEENRFCLAITKKRTLVHFQSLTSEKPDAELCAELRCISWPLLERDTFPIQPQVVFWGTENIPTEELGKNLGWPVKAQPHPTPHSSGDHWNLMPSSLRQQKESRSKVQKIKVFATLVAILYVLSLGALLGQMWLLSRSTKALQKEYAELEPTLLQVQSGMKEWQKLDLILNDQVSPLNHLLDASQNLPSTGIKLTSFSQDGYDIVIEGEAQNVSTAVAFLEKLKMAPSFRGYKWDTPQPQLLPSNIAKFKFKALNPYGSTAKK